MGEEERLGVGEGVVVGKVFAEQHICKYAELTAYVNT